MPYGARQQRSRRGSGQCRLSCANVHYVEEIHREGGREAVGAQTCLSFTNTRGGPGAPVRIPMMHKHDAGARSHYLTLDLRIPDAPAPGELVIALGAATGRRAHPRIGDRYQDIEDLKAAGEDTVVV